MTELQMLEKILDMVGKAGEGAYSLALVYLLQGYFYAIVWIALIVFLAFLAYRMVVRYSRAQSILKTIQNIMGCWGWIDDDGWDRIIQQISAMRENEIKK